MKTYYPLALCTLCSCFFGLGLGAYLVSMLTLPTGTMRQYSLAPSRVATIAIDGIYNQELRGSNFGSVRFILGEEVINLEPNSSFSIPAGPLLTHNVSTEVPTGMQFVASKRGKKYYSVHSKSAQSITPVNRVYFATVEEATLAGYVE